MSDEPAENISGGTAGGGSAAAFDPGDGTSRVEAFVDRLGERYWQKTYGGQDAFECLVRTVLSQNTSDKASQPAHDELMAAYASEDADLARALAAAEQDELADTISAAGLYNQKSATLIRLATRISEAYGGAAGFDEFVREGDYDEVRDTLLDMKGVGPKTADCVLLFAGGRDGVFPVDTHVHRIARRMEFAPPDADHEDVRQVMEAEVPGSKCGFGHTAMIQFGREFCTARKPACLEGPEACPMSDICEQVGVFPHDGDVVDPSEI